MPHRLEITLKPELFDAEGEGVRKKAADYFGIQTERVRTVHIVTIDADLSGNQLKKLQTEVFTNPVTQISSYEPLPVEFDRIVWIGYRPGVRDNPGSTAVEAVEGRSGDSIFPGPGDLHIKAILPDRKGSDCRGCGQDRQRASGQRYHPAMARLRQGGLGPGPRNRLHLPARDARPRTPGDRHFHGERRSPSKNQRPEKPGFESQGHSHDPGVFP